MPVFATSTSEVTCLQAAIGKCSSPLLGNVFLFLQQRPTAKLMTNIHIHTLSPSVHLTFRMLHRTCVFTLCFTCFLRTSLIFSHMHENLAHSSQFFACTHFLKGQSDKVAIKTRKSCDKLMRGKARCLVSGVFFRI